MITIRLGTIFITICTKEKQKLLCEIVGTGVLDGPKVNLTECGEVVQTQLCIMQNFYDDMMIDKYVIMPNHIHLLIHILDCGSGPSGRPVPTDSKIARFVGTFKRFCDKKYGYNIWQNRSHDHVIRGEKDYMKIWEYIDNNPTKWADGCFYTE